jgi:hypothetical protein
LFLKIYPHLGLALKTTLDEKSEDEQQEAAGTRADSVFKNSPKNVTGIHRNVRSKCKTVDVSERRPQLSSHICNQSALA